jgi:hypothetical protein
LQESKVHWLPSLQEIGECWQIELKFASNTHWTVSQGFEAVQLSHNGKRGVGGWHFDWSTDATEIHLAISVLQDDSWHFDERFLVFPQVTQSLFAAQVGGDGGGVIVGGGWHFDWSTDATEIHLASLVLQNGSRHFDERFLDCPQATQSLLTAHFGEGGGGGGRHWAVNLRTEIHLPVCMLQNDSWHLDESFLDCPQATQSLSTLHFGEGGGVVLHFDWSIDGTDVHFPVPVLQSGSWHWDARLRLCPQATQSLLSTQVGVGGGGGGEQDEVSLGTWTHFPVFKSQESTVQMLLSSQYFEVRTQVGVWFLVKTHETDSQAFEATQFLQVITSQTLDLSSTAIQTPVRWSQRAFLQTWLSFWVTPHCLHSWW